ncbi:hypothetical protein NXW64_03310 [Bacteroides ovatus]|nr:hypothetical protein NXW64_03310 [Bacteroides ovatus]
MKLIGLAVSLTCCAGFIDAQEANEPQERQQQEKHLPREVLNPEKVATQMTEQMNKLLQLTDKQYKKIYKLNLKEQKAFFKAMQNSDDYRPPMGEGPRYAGRTSANGWRTTANDGRRWFPGQNGRWSDDEQRYQFCRLTKESRRNQRKENKKDSDKRTV